MLDDLANPGLFGRSSYTWRQFLDAENIAYFTQYGRYLPLLARFSATAQRFPVASNIIGGTALAGSGGGLLYIGYGIYQDWDSLLLYFLGDDDE